jgi:hypothetical protein
MGNVLDMIRVHGHPLTRKEIYEGLSQRGILIKGKDPERVLGTMLSREKGLAVHLRGFGYWPSNEKYCPARYDVR